MHKLQRGNQSPNGANSSVDDLKLRREKEREIEFNDEGRRGGKREGKEKK